ncbi:unnamed protein product, partial [marine sediment metagenome]
RKGISEFLKDAVPEYKTKMLDVAEDAKLLSEINKFAKTPDRLRSTMSRINTPNSKEKRQAIKRLGEKLNIDYDEALERSAKTKRLLSSDKALREAKGKLPEAKSLEEIRKIGGHKLTTAQNKLKVADEKLKKALESYNSIRALKNAPNRTITSVRSKNKLALESISKLDDKDFVQMVDDAWVLDQFTKHAERGSRNVNLFAMIGMGTGVIAGGGLNPGAIALGGMLGAAVDRFGPQMTKKIINNVMRLKRIPTPAIIKKMKISKEAQEW